MTKDEFERSFEELLAKAMNSAHGNDDFKASIYFMLASHLGKAIAMQPLDETKTIEHFLTVAAQLAYEQAASLTEEPKFVKLLFEK
jgi:hypothetical protein